MKTLERDEEIVAIGNQRKNCRAWVAFLIVFPVLVFLEIAVGYVFFPAALRGDLDFRAFYGAGYMLRTGHSADLYSYESVRQFQNALLPRERRILSFTPYTHPAVEAAAYAPITFLNYRTAYLLFTGLNVAALACAVFLLLRAAPSHRWWLQVLLALGFIPLVLTLTLGQDSILVLLFLSAATFLLQKEKDLPAGFLAGLCVIRFQIAAPIFLLFLAWRRWRFALGFALSTMFVIGSSIAIMGIAGTSHYVHGLVAMSGDSLPQNQSYYRQFPAQMPNLRGMVVTVAGSHISQGITQMLIFTLSALLILWAATRKPKSSTQALLFAIPVAAVLSYHGYEHDSSILLVPLAFSFGAFPAESRLAAWTGLALVAAQSIAVLLRDWTALISIPLLAYAVAIAPRRQSAAFIHVSDSVAQPATN